MHRLRQRFLILVGCIVKAIIAATALYVCFHFSKCAAQLLWVLGAVDLPSAHISMTLIAGTRALILGSPPAKVCRKATASVFQPRGLDLMVGRGFLQRTAADMWSKMRPHMMIVECH